MVTDRDVTGVWSPQVRELTAGLVMTITLVAFEALSVATILPVVSRHLGDLRLYGWVFSAFFLSSLLGIVVGGALADRRGIRLPVIGGLAVFAVGLVVAGVAPNMPVLVCGRIVQGFGAGSVPAASYVAIGRAYPESIRPRMLAILATAWVFPGLVGPALAAQVAAHFGWRWVFLGLLPLVGVAVIVTVPALASIPALASVPTSGNHASDIPASSDRSGQSTPLLAAATVTAGAGLILVALTAANPWTTSLLFVAGAAVLVPSLRRLTPEGTLRARPGVAAAVLSRGLLTFAFFAGDAYVPLTLTSVRHTSTTFAGLTLTSATITWTAAAWVQARLVGRLGPRVLVRRGLTLVLAGLAGLAALLWQSTPVWLALVFWAVAGFGIGLAYSPISLVALGWSTPGREGQSVSALQLTDVLGTALGTGAAGAAVAIVHQHSGSAPLGLGIAFGAAAVVAFVGICLTPRLPTSPQRS